MDIAALGSQFTSPHQFLMKPFNQLVRPTDKPSRAGYKLYTFHGVKESEKSSTASEKTGILL